jgi:hypothetical protein
MLTPAEIIKRRDENRLKLLEAPDAHLVVLLSLASLDTRSHRMGCMCGGVIASIGLSCRELWMKVAERAALQMH